jgi:hypothetical protein
LIILTVVYSSCVLFLGFGISFSSKRARFAA